VDNYPSRVVAQPQTEEEVFFSNNKQGELRGTKSESAKEKLEAGIGGAMRSVESAKRKLADSTDQLRKKIARFANERPLHFIAAIGGAAFVVGVTLRIWRSNSHE
jgi:ElaB/YqjD/DUF883 family membrane-anchored ribosome-binding protein